MTVRTNRAMLELLGGDPEFFEPHVEPLPLGLLSELSEGFKEVDQCVVPTSFEPSAIFSDSRPRTTNLDDETAFECALSKIHVEDFVRSDVALSELARIGLGYAIVPHKSLSESPVSGNFRIIVDAQLPDSSLTVGSVCTVRFHKVRPDQVWLDTDLESYRQNAVLSVDFETPLGK